MAVENLLIEGLKVSEKIKFVIMAPNFHFCNNTKYLIFSNKILSVGLSPYLLMVFFGFIKNIVASDRNLFIN